MIFFLSSILVLLFYIVFVLGIFLIFNFVMPNAEKFVKLVKPFRNVSNEFEMIKMGFYVVFFIFIFLILYQIIFFIKVYKKPKNKD